MGWKATSVNRRTWGYVLEGGITVTYADGSTEPIAAGELFHLPPGHSVASPHGAEIVLFSPQNEHCAVVEHIRKQLAAH